ncbi:TPA: hypothetical protein GF915_08000 [Escherichia coli]|nr:hypothetical protein [Escherichia coli]
MHGFACVFLPHFLQIAPRPAWPERVSATALKPSHKAGGRGGESTARLLRCVNLFISLKYIPKLISQRAYGCTKLYHGIQNFLNQE